jgi:O-antigen ligase
VARLKLVTGQAQFGLAMTAAITLAALMLLTVSVVADSGTKIVAPALLAVVIFTVARNQLRLLFAWRSLLALTVLVILFIPIKRYSLPASLPFNLEPYRLIVAALAVFWLTSLLIDPRVRARASGLEAPIFLFVGAILVSLLANPARVNETSSFVIKGVSFFLSFVLVYLLIISVVRHGRDIDFLSRLLAGAGAAVALMAIIEARTGYNVFNHLRAVIPVLNLHADQALSLNDYRGSRAYGSAQHPIAMGVAFAMLLPLAVYRARAYAQRWWWAVAAVLLLGLLATRSRTAVLMLLAIALVFILLRPKEMVRLWPALLPALVVIHFALPGALGTVGSSFFPKGGLIAQQQNASVGSGRLATLGPALDSEFKPNPILGEGFATRITTSEPDFPTPNAPILDDGWLGILLETGVVGALALFWIFARAMRRTGKAAKRDMSPRGWFLAASCSSIAAYAVGMFTYDALSFIQSTFLLFILLGLAMAALRSDPAEWPLRRPGT